MIKSKLIELLKTFSSFELNELGKFINSPLHNDSKLMIKLYDSLKKYYPDFSNKRLTKENLYTELYGSTKYEDKKLRERLSDMHKLAVDYLSWMDYKKDPVTFKRHSLNQLTIRGLEIDFNKKFREIQSILDTKGKKNENFFYFQHNQLNDKRTFYETKLLTGKRKPYYEDLKSEIDQFTLYFVSKMLVYYILMQNREMGVKFDFDYKMYEPIMKFMSENNFDSYLTIRSFYLAVKLGENNENEAIYFELKKYLIAHEEFLEMGDKKLLFTELFNYAMFRSYKGKSRFEKEAFDIMNLQIKHETYPSENEGYMDYAFYISYVMLSIGLGSLELTEKFINDHTRKLNPLKEVNICPFAKGLLHYAQKEYSKAIEDISKIGGVDFTLYIRIKALLSKIFFDQEEYESVLTLIDSFKHYLSSNKMIPESLRIKYTNFINILRRLTLLSVSLEKDEYNISKLISDINNFSIEELTTNKSWLLERVHKLLGGLSERKFSSRINAHSKE